MGVYGFSKQQIPELRPLFSSHGELKHAVADRLQLKAGIPVAYKAGDQPNNALSLNVLEPGEVATTAGTSGVIYGVSDVLSYDQQSRINSFAHVNYSEELRRIGVLLCINGTGIFNRWIKNLAGSSLSYAALNELAAGVDIGANGLRALPFGNGAERMLNNRIIGGHLQALDFNIHTTAHLVRAVQEGIACSFRYGLDIMRENGIQPAVVRASKANLFLSDVFTRAFATLNQVSVEFYEGDGSFGAAIGAGIGARIYASTKEAGSRRKPIGSIEPGKQENYETIYQEWKALLNQQLASQH
jgi:xylulokinase